MAASGELRVAAALTRYTGGFVGLRPAWTTWKEKSVPAENRKPIVRPEGSRYIRVAIPNPFAAELK